jgi:hypothetical protein
LPPKGHRPELKLSLGARKLVLARQLHLLAVRAQEVADLAQVDPL